MSIGAVMTLSASASVDRPILWWALWKSPAIRQLLFVGAGLLAMLVATRIPYRIWSAGRREFIPALLFLLLALGTLALVFVPGIGVMVNNARRWIQLGPVTLGIRFQPSELVKIALPIFLACWMTAVGSAVGPACRAGLSRPRSRPAGGTYRCAGTQSVVRIPFWRGLFPAVIVIGISVAAVGIEDFGTAALLAAVAGAMLLVGGAKLWHLCLMALPVVPAFGYLLMSRSHRMERIMIFRDIWRDPQNKGYQAVQSLSTIAGGDWWGRGLGRGFVKGYLPEARTDFIFSVICEELGIIGAAAVIALLMVLVWQGLTLIRRCPDPMGRLLAFGIAFTLGLQAAINIAVVTVCVPTKGIALPLVSGGGSGVIFLGALVGVLANIARHSGDHR